MNKNNIKKTNLNKKHKSYSSSDYFAKVICSGLRLIADFCFKFFRFLELIKKFNLFLNKEKKGN